MCKLSCNFRKSTRKKECSSSRESLKLAPPTRQILHCFTEPRRLNQVKLKQTAAGMFSIILIRQRLIKAMISTARQTYPLRVWKSMINRITGILQNFGSGAIFVLFAF